jgi:radical SAM protein with 4Fe4S-binding SPASM domain
VTGPVLDLLGLPGASTGTAGGPTAQKEGRQLRNPMQLDAPVKLTVSYTANCPLDCRHCYAGCGTARERPELTGQEWMELLDRRLDAGVISILFEGGEPLARPDFLEVLTRCSLRSLTRLRTNGWLVTEQMAERLRESGVGTVLVDFMGARAESHDWFTQRDGAFKRACAAVRSLVKAGVPTQMLIILNRRNMGDLADFLKLAGDLGVDTVGILRLYPIGRAKALWSELALTLDEQMAVLKALRPPEGMRLMQSWHPNNGNCCWQMAALTPVGDSVGCSYLREFVNYGNVRDVSFEQTWDHPLYRELRAGHVESSCGSCSSREGSHGGCRSTAYAFHGRWSAADPFDIDLNEGVDLRDLPQWMLQARPRPPDPTST